MNSPKQDEDDVPVKDPVKYGELVILGYVKEYKISITV